ncbi:MAG: hypothetical protein ACI8Q6_003484, partial [Granulosicoccus sp.]
MVNRQLTPTCHMPKLGVEKFRIEFCGRKNLT